MSGGLWLPGQPVNGTPRRVVRPFEKLGKEIKKRGFDTKIAHDAKERVITVRFIPTTEKTVQACVSAGGDGDGLEVSLTYSLFDNPGEAALACIEHGLTVLQGVME